MNKLILFTSIFFTFNAHASFYQVNCSNSDGTVKASYGHVQNSISITERIWHNGSKKETIVEVSNEVNKKYSDEIELEETNQSACKNSNISSWNKVSAKKITIIKKDNSSFAKEIVGVSKDGKSISAYLICEENGNSRMFCPRD